MEAVAVAAWLFPYIGAVLSLALKGKLRDTIAVLMLLLSALCSTILLNMVLTTGEAVVYEAYWVKTIDFNIQIYVDSLAAFMSVVVSWLSFLIGFYSLKYMEHDTGLTRYWFFFDFFVGSMQLLVLSGNILLMFLGWEGTGLASYALIGHWYRDEKEKWVGDHGRVALGVPMAFSPSHSGVRAIVFTRIGDVGLLAGIAVLYALTGTFSIQQIAERSPEWASTLASKGLLLPFLLTFTLGAMAKSAQFPFHEWLVTAMTGPTSVSALIHAATMVKAGVYFMLRFAPIFHYAATYSSAAAPSVHAYFSIIALIGGFTAFFMATQALVARELKLILAFSTASQLGYMFLAAGASGLLHEFPRGFAACFSHLASHAIFKASLFLAAGAIIHSVETRYIDGMGGLSKHMKYTFIAMVIAALSLSGVPPFMGFWTKDAIIEAAKHAGLEIPFILGLVTAYLTAFYSMRMVFRVFLTSESENVRHLRREHELHEAHPIMLTPFLILAALSLAIGVAWPLLGPGFLEAATSNVIGIEERLSFHLEVDVETTVSSVLLVTLGIITATVVYLKPAYQPQLEEKIESVAVLSSLRDLLYDRYLINSIYYKALVYGLASLARIIYKMFDTLIVDGFYHRLIPAITSTLSIGLYENFETPVVDDGYHRGVPSMFTWFGRKLRMVQTGRINQYIALFFIGAAILLILIWVM